MGDFEAKYIGRYINLKCKSFTCMGKIESITDVHIVLSNAKFSDSKLCTRYTGIDLNLILEMDFVPPPTNKKTLNVYTSETQPPCVKRGGSSSAVNRNLNRNCISQDKCLMSKSFNGFSPITRKFSTDHQTKQPAWMDFSLDNVRDDFDFDKNLALFDKHSLNHSKKPSNETGSDSSDSGGKKVDFNKKHYTPQDHHRKNRAQTISFDSDEFPSNEYNPRPVSEFQPDFSNDIMSQFKQIGIIPSSTDKEYPSSEEVRKKFLFRNLPEQFSQQPDLVREITQNQLTSVLSANPILMLCQSPATPQSMISTKKTSTDFPHFKEFWNLDKDHIFPVFTIKQRNLLFETACQLGLESNTINETIGENISEFVLSQVKGHSRSSNPNSAKVPKIIVLLGCCTASVYVTFIAKYLLNKGCHILVFVDETQQSDINYMIDYRINALNKQLSKTGPMYGFNFITNNIKDLTNKTVDFIISGLESESNSNSPNDLLQYWCSKQRANLLSINPPQISWLPWKSAIFIGVPTCSRDNLKIKVMHSPENGRTSKYASDGDAKNERKSDGLILLCNIDLPQKAFEFLNMNYQSPFEHKKLVRLYRDNDLSSVE